jgi:hypothetical protein
LGGWVGIVVGAGVAVGSGVGVNVEVGLAVAVTVTVGGGGADVLAVSQPATNRVSIHRASRITWAGVGERCRDFCVNISLPFGLTIQHK